MAITDTDINKWAGDYGGADTNVPTQATSVGTEVDDHFRNMKAVIRAESLDSGWIRPGILSSAGRYTVKRATSTKLTTDAPAALFNYGRALMALSGGTRSYHLVGAIASDLATNYGGGVLGLGVAVDVLTGVPGATTLPTPLDEIYVGGFAPNGPSTVNFARGHYTLPATGNGPFTVTLERTMPNANYYVLAQIRAPSAAAPGISELAVKVTERATTYVKVQRYGDATGAAIHTLQVLCVGY